MRHLMPCVVVMLVMFAAPAAGQDEPRIGLLFAFIFHRTRNLWLVGIFHGIGNVYINGAGHIASLLS